MILEYAIKDDVEGEDLPIINVVAYLPADRSFGIKKADSFGNRSCLALDYIDRVTFASRILSRCCRGAT